MPWLFQYRGAGPWWIGYRLHGKQVLRSTGHTEREKAEQELKRLNAMVEAQKANALNREVFQHLTGKAASNATLKAALEDWITEVTGSVAKKTLEKYTGLQKLLLEYFHATDQGPILSEITRQDLQKFLAERRRAVSSGTANDTRKCLSIFWRRSKFAGLTQENPTEGIPMFRAGGRTRRAFTVKEVSNLYEQAPDDFWRYMVLGAFFTGLRMGDLVTMPVGAVDFNRRTISIRARKTGKTLHIPIAKPFLGILRKLRAKRCNAKPADHWWPKQAERYLKGGSGWFSQRFYDLMLVKAGLVTVRPHRKTGKKPTRRNTNDASYHCFRHSFVSTLAALGHNQQVVKALAGHSDDAISDLYTHVPAEVLTGVVASLPDVTKQRK